MNVHVFPCHDVWNIPDGLLHVPEFFKPIAQNKPLTTDLCIAVMNRLSSITDDGWFLALSEHTDWRMPWKSLALVQKVQDELWDYCALLEKFVYVKPEYRQGTTLLRTLDAIEAFAKKIGVKHVWMGSSNRENQDKYIKFLEHRGFSVLNITCSKEVS